MSKAARTYLATLQRRRIESRSAAASALVIAATGLAPFSAAGAREGVFERLVQNAIAEATSAAATIAENAAHAAEAVIPQSPKPVASEGVIIIAAPSPEMSKGVADKAIVASDWSRCRTYDGGKPKSCAIPLSARGFPIARAEVKWLSPSNVTVDFVTDGLTVSQSQRLGGEVVALQRHVFGSSLDQTRSWRREVDASISIHDSDISQAELILGVFETQRPIILAKGGLGLDRFARWRQNAVADVATRVSFFDRIKLTGGVAAAETAMRQHVETEPWIWQFEGRRADTIDRGAGAFATFSAVPFNREGLKSTVTVSYTSADVDYRNFQSNTVGDIIYEGETLDIDAAATIGKTKFSASVERHDDPIYAFDETKIGLRRGAVSLKGIVGRESAIIDDFVYFDDRRYSGHISADLRKILGIKDGKAPFAPDEVRFGFSGRSALSDTFAGSAEAERRTIGAGASFFGEKRSTDVYVFWNARQDDTLFSDFAASSEFGADVTHSFFGDDWDLSLYASMSDLNRTRRYIDDGAERMFSAGVSASKKFRYIPTLRASFDAFTFSENRLYAEEAFQNHDLSVKGEIELSEMLFTGRDFIIDDRRPLSLYAALYHGWSVSEADAAFRFSDRETRFLLMLRRRL